VRKVLVSACLLGDAVRYDGQSKGAPHPVLSRWIAEGRVVKVCPEVAGGLPVPRPPAEQQPDGRVLTRAGADVTPAFERGAAEALRLARAHDVVCAVLKEGSPSCGSGFVYDGTFTRRALHGGLGVTARLLRGEGIAVFSELQWAEAGALVDRVDPAR
jgi:uncharacterized protein YbbK (DUF523 family)